MTRHSGSGRRNWLTTMGGEVGKAQQRSQRDMERCMRRDPCGPNAQARYGPDSLAARRTRSGLEGRAA